MLFRNRDRCGFSYLEFEGGGDDDPFSVVGLGVVAKVAVGDCGGDVAVDTYTDVDDCCCVGEETE